MLIKSFYIILISLFQFLALSAQLYSPIRQGLEIGNNYRVYPSGVTQTEVFIARSPVDEGIIFSSCNTLTFIPFFVSEGIYVSNDGGNSWGGSDTCIGEPVEFHGGDPGITIDKNGTFILTRLGRAPFSGLYSHRSTDMGVSWTSQVPISTDDLERASLTTDAVEASSFFGRGYACWVKFAQPFPLMFSYTDDGGLSWSDPINVNNPSQRSAGGDITVGPSGEVNACWAGVTENSPFKETLVGFASSLDGGLTWAVNENAFSVNGITGILPQKDNIRVNGLPGLAVDTTEGPWRGWVYIVTGQKDLLPAGEDPDIILNRSIDGGQTWSEGIRVNQDPLSNGKIQYFPSVHVDLFGAINIIFYDDRETTSDSAGVFLARSTDGGDTWKEFEISDHNYKPTPIGGLGQGYQGDNIDLTSTSTSLLPVWMDNSTGTYQIWTVPIDFTSINNLSGRLDITPAAELYQNYPNPFSVSTKISFRFLEPGSATLMVYDVNGKEIACLLDEFVNSGYHSVSLDAMNLQGGIYYYRLSANQGHTFKKMLLIKP